MNRTKQEDIQALKNAIDQAKAEGKQSYRYIGEILGITKQRVEQRIRIYGIEDYYDLDGKKKKFKQKAIDKLNAMIVNNEVHNLTIYQIRCHINKTIDKQTIIQTLENANAKHRPEFANSKIVKMKNKAETNGFLFSNHTSKEIYNYLKANGYIDNTKAIAHISKELCRTRIEFKKQQGVKKG